jgi:hypothetical protein
VVVTTAGQGLTAYDRATGTRTGELVMDLRPDNSDIKVDDGSGCSAALRTVDGR